MSSLENQEWFELVEGVVHDLNSPLSVIHARSSLLLRNAKRGAMSSEEILTNAEALVASSARMVELLGLLGRALEQREKKTALTA